MKLLQAAVKQLDEACDMQGMGKGMGRGGPQISPNGLMSFMVGRNRAEEEEGTEDMGPEDESNSESVTVDVALMARIMQFAKENADDDSMMQHIIQKMTELSAEGESLTMDNYDEIVSNIDQARSEDDMGGDEMSQDDVQGM